MEAKAESVSGCYKAMALLDLDTSEEGAPIYSDAPELKNKLNFVNPLQIVPWGLGTLSEEKYYLSVLIAGLLGSTDNEWGNVPVKSPSNMVLPIDGLCNAAGEEINLTQEQANYLNGEGS